MDVLVTGGSGWIGRATCKALGKAGHRCLPYDRATGGDVCDLAGVMEAVESAEHVIHLAGVLGTHELFADPIAAIEINVEGTLNVVLACVRHGVGLTNITMPRVNPSLYAATKSCAMDIAEAYRHAQKLRVSYVRAYNAYGPGQAYGGDHPQKIIPTFATRAYAGEPLPVWGTGALLVDLVHVDDVARVLVEAIAYGDGEVFDAGSGHPQTVLEIAQRVLEITGSSSTIERLEPRLGERLVSTEHDVARGAGWDLMGGWRPTFDPRRFEEAVRSYGV